MDTTFLKVWLPFDESTTKDLCWNGWTAYGSPTIQDNALYLPGSSSYLAMDGGITLGGQNFTIRGKFNMDSSSGSYCRIFSLHKASQTVDNVINLRRNASNAGLVVDCMGVMNSAFGVTLNTIHHFELDYIHGENKLRVFIDGTLVQTITVTIPQTTFDYCWLGRSNYSSDGYFVGSIDEFQIFDGVALHTTNFTPPTDEDYIQGKLAFGAANFNFTADVQRNVSNTVEVSFDVERKVKTKWRYVNPGTADTLTITGTTLTNLSADKSKTGTAFYQTQRVKCFDLAATPEVWMKFDVYFDGSNRWRAYNDGSAGSCGICSYSDGDFGMWQNNNRIQDFSGICKTNQLQTVLLHMVSGSSDGVIEAWVDGVEIHTYTGDVNHGDDFADIYLQSDGSGTFFSNVIISNVEIKLDEGYHTISLDTERRISNIVDFFSDVERNIIQPVIVPLIGEHFNHCVESIKIFRDKPQPIILPKKSVAYIRATSDGAIKIFSDVDTTGKRINSENNSLSGELDLCELVFIKPDLPTNASKKIIRKLFPRLEKSNLYGTEKLNDAVYFASEGKFQTWRAVIDKFINDLDNAATYTDFLENYCDIVLDNDDTGAITGSDAGGVITKTAASVVPEVTAPENWVVPEAGSTVTINGLNVVFPSNGSSGNGFTAAEEHIMAGLNSVWIKQSLDLIEESFGLSFNDEEAGTKTITVTFKYDSNYSATAAVSYSYQLNTNKFRDLNLIINMAYYAEIDTTSEDGLLVPYSSRYYTAGYLDRVIAHEMTHAIMASAIPYFNGMPTYIKEGAAELVHGIDDLRTNTIIELLTTQKDTLKNILKGLSSPSGAQSYAAGYIFLRYLAKQASGDEIPETMLITNLFIDDGGTGQLFFPDVLRTLIKTTEDNFDVEILDVIPVEFLADIKRDLLTRLILFPRNSEDFFSDVNNPFLRSRRTASPPNTVGLQSFELTIAEQQITDQVKFTGIIPFDIMQQVKGQYFDYNFNMRVERVQQQGILYSCDCCFDIDQLLFTQMNYKIPPMTWSYKVDGEIVGEIKTVEVKTYYPPASEHVKKIAAALGLNPVMQFDDFLSTVLMDDLGGVTYNDLIRDVFGWSSRVPTQLINVFIRDGNLFVIERGHEAHTVDITNVEKTLPIVTKELVRTTWGSTIWSKTENREMQAPYFVPADKVIDTSGDGSEKYSEIETAFSSPAGYGYTKYSYNSKGLLVKTFTSVFTYEKNNVTESTVNYTYDDDGTMIKTETSTNTHDIDGNRSSSRNVVKKTYGILPNGEKFLASEYTATYENEKLVDWKHTTHSPSRVGQSHSTTISDGEISGAFGGQNTGDDRVTPFRKRQAKDLTNHINSNGDWDMVWNPDTKTWEKNPDVLNPDTGTWETHNHEWSTTINGLPLYDSSFPIHNKDKLIQVTNALRNLNRKTCETVSLTIYNFPHIIDLNDKIIINNSEFFLVQNIVNTMPRIISEQHLTLVRWY